jgi:hypothetical protein
MREEHNNDKEAWEEQVRSLLAEKAEQGDARMELMTMRSEVERARAAKAQADGSNERLSARVGDLERMCREAQEGRRAAEGESARLGALLKQEEAERCREGGARGQKEEEVERLAGENARLAALVKEERAKREACERESAKLEAVRASPHPSQLPCFSTSPYPPLPSFFFRALIFAVCLVISLCFFCMLFARRRRCPRRSSEHRLHCR